MKFESQLKDLYKKYKSTGYSISLISSIIADKHKEIKLSKHTIEVNLGKIKRQDTEVAIIANTPNWEVRGKDYLFSTSKGNVKKYSIDFIDKLFLHYSRHGFNFSRTKLCNRFDLSVRAFGEIQRIFLLYKDANIISPYTVQNTPKAELENILEEQTTKVIRSGEMTEQKFNDSVIREYKKVIREDNTVNLRLQEMLHELSIDLPKLKKEDYRTNTETENGPLVATLADLHAGAKNHESLLITEDYSIEIAKEKLKRIAAIINSYKSVGISISFLGDLIESLSGLNHPDSWKGMEANITGWKSISTAYELIINFLDSIDNLKAVYGVAGNHDRSQKSNQESDTLATDAVFYMLKEYYKNSGVVVDYSPSVLSISCDGIGYILMHGHLAIHKKSVAELILDFAIQPKDFQFILTGHLHTRILERGNDTHRGRKMSCPSVFTGNKFSDDLGVSCKSGIIICGKDQFGEPFSIDRSC